MRDVWIAGTAILVLSALSIMPATAQKAGPVYPDCYCTNRGERVEIGDSACLDINGRKFAAICYMSQNTPAWRKISDGCEAAPSV
ncbi:MAG: hypothetical protein R3C97_01855 [Geminicoccaceae bacterium]